MKSPGGTLTRWGLSIAIGAGFAYLALKDWPVQGLLNGIGVHDWRIVADSWSVHLVWFPLYFATLVSMHVFRVWRWKPLLKPLADVDFWTLNRVCSVGFLAMFVLPVRLGELVRPALISTEVNLRRSPALATIVVERTIDGVMVAGFLAVVLVFLPRGNSSSYVELQIATYLALALFSALVLGLVLLFVFRRRVTVFLKAFIPRLAGHGIAEAVAGVLDRFLQGLSIFPDTRNFLLFIVGSLLYWGSNCLGLYVLAIGFGLDIPFTGAVAMMATIVVGMMIPNPPGNVGTFWYFLLKPLELYGLSGRPAALVFAMSVYGMQFLQLILFGGWFILKGDVSFKKAFTVSWSELA
ncbi:MAG: flippase-like domain-containing protein [Deltaproteobacteria bacterium]|nr:flippase-like domain-containing protein [Deltaproteobacteria bacterium]